MMLSIITSSQCRAARALLNWSQPELASRCDIHVQTISNFENDTSTPSKSTLTKILMTFTMSGIVCIENKLFAEAFRSLFNFAWENAKPVK